MNGEFTGRRMLGVMVSFFGVVIAVNAVMATLAVRSFGGKVVDNSYVASQNFNAWLAAADRQQQRWKGSMTLDRDRHVSVRIAQDGMAAVVRNATGVAYHPTTGDTPLSLSFVVAERGQIRSTNPLPPGRWDVAVTVSARDGEARFREFVQ